MQHLLVTPLFYFCVSLSVIEEFFVKINTKNLLGVNCVKGGFNNAFLKYRLKRWTRKKILTDVCFIMASRVLSQLYNNTQTGISSDAHQMYFLRRDYFQMKPSIAVLMIARIETDD